MPHARCRVPFAAALALCLCASPLLEAQPARYSIAGSWTGDVLEQTNLGVKGYSKHHRDKFIRKGFSGGSGRRFAMQVDLAREDVTGRAWVMRLGLADATMNQAQYPHMDPANRANFRDVGTMRGGIGVRQYLRRSDNPRRAFGELVVGMERMTAPLYWIQSRTDSTLSATGMHAAVSFGTQFTQMNRFRMELSGDLAYTRYGQWRVNGATSAGERLHVYSLGLRLAVRRFL